MPTCNRVEVLILQHPLEVNQAKGSARLLHLSLGNSRMMTGEVFDEDQLLLSFAVAQKDRQMQNMLLYPALDVAAASDAQTKALLGGLGQSTGPKETGIRLIVLDGTWRKSRKMLYCNPWLQKLPRLALQDMPTSHYRIRKAHKADQLSTLEATCAALSQLEGNPAQYLPLLAAFDGFVAQQMARRPDSDAMPESFSHRDRSAPPA